MSRSRISTGCHVCYAEQRRAGFGIYHPASPPQKYGQKNALNNLHGDFFESRIRACPELVGVGKFCRLRLRLRLRAKQPTPTDSDSDSDYAALMSRLVARCEVFIKYSVSDGSRLQAVDGGESPGRKPGCLNRGRGERLAVTKRDPNASPMAGAVGRRPGVPVPRLRHLCSTGLDTLHLHSIRGTGRAGRTSRPA